MTHVKISRNEDGGHAVEVDGFDLSPHVLTEGFRVEIDEDFTRPDRVHVILAADTLDADLHDSVLSVVRAEADNA